jgi:hypothetical protein
VHSVSDESVLSTNRVRKSVINSQRTSPDFPAVGVYISYPKDATLAITVQIHLNFLPILRKERSPSATLVRSVDPFELQVSRKQPDVIFSGEGGRLGEVLSNST